MAQSEFLTYNPIDIPLILSKIHSPLTGGIVLFSGEVRNKNKGRDVQYLEYEAFEIMAEKIIKEILDYARVKWMLTNAICMHRLGRLDISDCAVIVITCSAHRAEAYEANRFIIEKVKMEVPIWKKEFFADGTFEWGSNSDCKCSHYEIPNASTQAIKPPRKFETFTSL